ncbi:hypothetical protein Tco_0605586 [Tanacetum coccineum]
MPTAAEAEMPVIEVETKNGAKNGAENKLIKTPENKETMEAPGSQPIAHYLKHKINEKLIKGLVNNNKFNNSRSRTRVGKKRGRNINIGDLKHVNALVDQGSNVNVMPYSTYMKLTDERPAETDIRLSLASHSYIYPLGIAEDMLVLEWEEKIKLHLIREMKFNQWRSKNFKGKRPTLVATKEGIDDEGEVT